jgi:hypothetical protein
MNLAELRIGTTPEPRTSVFVLEQFVAAVLAFLSRGYLVDTRIIVAAREAAQLSRN